MALSFRIGKKVEVKLCRSRRIVVPRTFETRFEPPPCLLAFFEGCERERARSNILRARARSAVDSQNMLETYCYVARDFDIRFHP